MQRYNNYYLYIPIRFPNILAIATTKGLYNTQLDVNNVIFYRNLHEKAFISLQIGYIARGACMQVE